MTFLYQGGGTNDLPLSRGKGLMQFSRLATSQDRDGGMVIVWGCDISDD